MGGTRSGTTSAPQRLLPPTPNRDQPNQQQQRNRPGTAMPTTGRDAAAAAVVALFRPANLRVAHRFALEGRHHEVLMGAQLIPNSPISD